MINIDKVKLGLRAHNKLNCKDCPYDHRHECQAELNFDALKAIEQLEGKICKQRNIMNIVGKGDKL